MNTSIAKVNKAIWPLKFEHLHRDCFDWLSQVEFWKYELRHLEKTMKHFLLYPLSKEEALLMKGFFNELMGNLKPRIRGMEGWIRSFHRQLSGIANPEIQRENLKNGKEHRYIYRQMDDFRRQLAKLKKALYSLLCQILREEKSAQNPYRAIWTHQYSRQLRQSG